MLSKDEISDGMTFILKLWDAGGVASTWIETLRGDTAKHWFDIYRRSDWVALRNEARDVFHRHVSEPEAEAVRTSRNRCIYIQTHDVISDSLAAGKGSR